MDSKNREKSAIDVIYDLSESIAVLDKRVTVLDSNIKLLNNKLSKLSKGILLKEESVRPNIRAPSAHAVAHVEASTPSANNKSKDEPDKLILGNISLYGYIVNPSKVPIVDAVVNVLGPSGSMVRDVRTNSDGYWSARLPPGKYEVMYKMQGYKQVSRIVSLDSNIDKYEVR